MASILKELQFKRDGLQAQGEEILAAVAAEARALTDDERTKSDAIQAQIAGIDDLRRRQVAILDDERRQARDLPESARISDVHDRAGDAPWSPQVAQNSPSAQIERARAIGFGAFVQAVHRAKMYGQVDPRLFQAAAQGAGIADGSDGGFLVPPEFANDLSYRITQGEILSRVRRRTMSGNTVTINVIDESSRATGSRFGAVQGYWVDEGTAPTATRPKLARVRLELNKAGALGYATDELLADTGGLFGQLIGDAFVEELRFMAEDAIIEGTGAGQPQGLLTATATVSVSKETGQAAATIVMANINKMWSRMEARYRAGAVWLINQDIEPQLDSMTLTVGTGGVPVYLPPGGLSDTPYARLKGRPVIPVEYCPTLGTVGDIMLVNLDRYMLIEHTDGPEAASSMHVAFTTDEMAFRAMWRIDGQPLQRSALTPFKGTANTLSPFVTLATRA